MLFILSSQSVVALIVVYYSVEVCISYLNGMLKRGNIFLFELSWIAQNFITVKAKIWHNDLQHHNISSFYITLTTNKSLHKFTWVKIQNTVFSLLWSQHMVSNINHHKGHQIMFHINISSEYCIHVYLTIVSVLLENLGDFRRSCNSDPTITTMPKS